MTQTHDPQAGRGALRTDQSELIFEEGFSFSGYERDPLYLNLGKKFLDISGISGIDSITDGRGALFADFDNDGDLDVFMTTIQGDTHLLFRNNVGQEKNWLRVVLEGAGVGRDAFGAVVRIQTSAGTLTKMKDGGAGFISQHDPRLLFGLGADERAEWVEVTWPNGQVELFHTDSRAGETLLLRQGEGRGQRVVLGRAQLPDPLSRAEKLARELKLEIGEPAPDLPLRTLVGRATSLGQELRPGRRTLMNVWATWCLPCRFEMLELEKLRPALRARGIDVMGLNVDTDPEAKIEEFLEGIGVRYPTYVGGVGAIEQLYAGDQLIIPLTLLLEKGGIAGELIPGWSEETRQRFAALAGVEAEASALPTSGPKSD